MQRARPVALVVEDDPKLSAVLRKLLEHAGCSVECVAERRDGQARLSAGGVDLVLLEMMSPDTAFMQPAAT
jgi:DNA-binding response OmpR family regulator